ncbi:hypothetical protein Vdis_1830 [Vulcanisaeta distributa DSM 14429]|uniref:Uncharacterized protein n=1 Tax=Vulcanisaeta distributa (strain DSM 14429 / JCM 11212 / NBRC 100878 / IC-017) TaxID=572478 RepID=E1QV11_VULDI|nr:hypothetical protein Vdis_1830 [Vulcanisaeta distributa DSM 14429]
MRVLHSICLNHFYGFIDYYRERFLIHLITALKKPMNVESIAESRVMNSLRIDLKVSINYEVKLRRLSRLIRLRKLMSLGL